MYIPLLYIGINGIIAALLTSMVILAISIYILNGWSSKTLCAIVGTTSGVIISGGLAMIIGKLSNLSGYNISDVESMIYIAYNSKLRVSYILYAGICKMYGKTENEARKMLRDVDRRRATNYAYYTDEVWGQAKNYTLCLNSSKLGFDKCEEIIIGLL